MKIYMVSLLHRATIIIMVTQWNRADRYIFAVWFLSSIFFFFAWSQLPQIGCLPYFDAWCGFSANLECRCEICCKRLAGNTGHKKWCKNAMWALSHNSCEDIAQLLRHVSRIGKKLVNPLTGNRAANWQLSGKRGCSHRALPVCKYVNLQRGFNPRLPVKGLSINVSSRCPYSMVNFGPLTAEIDWRVWGTPSYFNGYHVLAALLHGSRVVGVSQTLRCWTEGATYVRQSDHQVGHRPTF